jgi:hypothetical protein
MEETKGTSSLANELNEIKEAMRRLDVATPASMLPCHPLPGTSFSSNIAPLAAATSTLPASNGAASAAVDMRKLSEGARVSPSSPPLSSYWSGATTSVENSTFLGECNALSSSSSSQFHDGLPSTVSNPTTIRHDDTVANSATSLATLGLGGSTTSTKAVLSALRALQDKIRRLEAERQSAVDQCARLRSKIQHVELQNQQHLDSEIQRSSEHSAAQASTIEQLGADKGGLETRLSRYSFVLAEMTPSDTW